MVSITPDKKLLTLTVQFLAEWNVLTPTKKIANFNLFNFLLNGMY